MASKGVCIKVQDHGTAVDEKKKRVRCNYCAKVVSGFSRLKCHLGWIRGDVVSCNKVPAYVKEAFTKELHEKKKGNLSRDAGELSYPNLPLRRHCSPSNSSETSELRRVQTSQQGSEKRLKTGTSENCGAESSSLDPCSQLAVENQRSSSREIQKCVGRFFFETGLDFDAVNSTSFRRMMNAMNTSRSIPTCEDLKGWILLEVWKEMQKYVANIQGSWSSTGCSILLDGWQDSTGRTILNVLAACPKGTVYIRSADVSGFDQESDSMQSFLDEVLNEVGVENVVQVVTYDTSSWMVELGKQIMEKYDKLFWTVSGSHCIQLMLEKIGTLKDIQDILEKAKTIARFVHGHASILKLLRGRTSLRDLVKPSKYSFTVPFLTLENMVSERENIQKLFLSPLWKTSSLAVTLVGRRVAELVADDCFWTGAMVVLKSTIPLVRVLDLISKRNEPKLGVIYETMDQAKETIKEQFDDKKSSYLPFWKAIDEIWNQYFHSPLHAAGYFLNPQLFYADDFYSDTEVASGLLCCVVRMSEDKVAQDLISLQVEEYRTKKGDFCAGSVQRGDFSPASWWLRFGTGHPQLQKLAIRVLSQTCNGAVQFKLKRSLAEKLVTKGRNPIEQRRLADMEFVHYNLHLKMFNEGAEKDLPSDDIDPMDDWVVDEMLPVLTPTAELTWMELDCMDGANEGLDCTVETSGGEKGDLGRSGVLPKQEWQLI